MNTNDALPTKIHNGHRSRMKSRFLQEGLSSFDAHNILELLLYYSIARRDTNDVAHRLISSFGSLSGVLDAPYEALLGVEGISESSALLIKLIPALSREYLNDLNNPLRQIITPENAAEYLIPKFVGETSETLFLLSLDNKGILKKCSKISNGGVNMANVNIRKLVSELINSNATTAIISHNHPNGIAVPSKNDYETTSYISKVFKSIDVVLVDHIIISGSDYFAMSQNIKYSSCLCSNNKENYVVNNIG